MIASVTQLSSSNAGQRASADEVVRQKLEAQERSVTPNATETPAPRSAVVQISAEAASQSQTLTQQAPTRAAQQAAPQVVRLAPAAGQGQDGSSSATTDLRYYDPEDADKNGQISEFEQQAYDYRHPPSLAQQQLAQQQQQQQLRAYAEVARSGQVDPQT